MILKILIMFLERIHWLAPVQVQKRAIKWETSLEERVKRANFWFQQALREHERFDRAYDCGDDREMVACNKRFRLLVERHRREVDGYYERK